MNILEKTPEPVWKIDDQTRATFAEAWRYTMETIKLIHRAGHNVIASAVWQDRFKRFRPRDEQSKILGFGKKAVADCARLAPGGTWTVRATTVGNTSSLLGDIGTRNLGGYQFSLHYSKYLPYAHAMVNAEDGYKAFGLDFDSVNGFHKTCMGYADIAREAPMEAADTDLYDELAEATFKVRSPGLPFDEVYDPAMCFLYARRPDIFNRLRKPDSMNGRHVRDVAERFPKLFQP